MDVKNERSVGVSKVIQQKIQKFKLEINYYMCLTSLSKSILSISDFGFIIDAEFIIVLTLVETILYSASIMKPIAKKLPGIPPFLIKK